MIDKGDLQNRQADPRGSEAVQADIQRMKGKRKLDAAEDLATRLQAARDLVPSRDEQLHCGHCWGQGRDAAIRVIEGAPDSAHAN